MSYDAKAIRADIELFDEFLDPKKIVRDFTIHGEQHMYGALNRLLSLAERVANSPTDTCSPFYWDMTVACVPADFAGKHVAIVPLGDSP